MAEWPDETHVFDEARAGSTEALGEALEACRSYLLVVADHELDADLRAKGGASDLVQETFLEAHRDFSQFRGESPDELLGWLRRLLKNNVSNFLRNYRGTAKRQSSREVAADDATSAMIAAGLTDHRPTPSRIVMDEERAMALRKAIAALPEDQGRILQLRYMESRSFEEIAELMGRSSNAARKLWGRAVESLQRELDSSQ